MYVRASTNRTATNQNEKKEKRTELRRARKRKRMREMVTMDIGANRIDPPKARATHIQQIHAQHTVKCVLHTSVEPALRKYSFGPTYMCIGY